MPIEDKESYKWLKSYQATAAVQANCPRTTLVSVGDREADIYELLQEAAAHPEGPKLLVRAEHNRKLQDEQQRLWETMQARPVEAVQVLQVPSRAIAPHARRAWRFATPPSVCRTQKAPRPRACGVGRPGSRARCPRRRQTLGMDAAHHGRGPAVSSRPARG